MKPIRICTLSGIVFLFSFSAISQRKYLEEGDEFYAQRMYREAITSYQLALAEDVVVKKFYMTQQVARTYKKLFDYANASAWYAKLMDFKDENPPENIKDYADLLMNLGRYDEAAQVYENYCKRIGKPEWIARYKERCSWPSVHKNEKARDYHVYQTGIETGSRSLGLAYYQEGLVYAMPQSNDFKEKTVFYDLGYAKALDTLKFDQPVKLPGDVNKDFYEASPCFTRDGTTLYFTANSTTDTKYKEKKKKNHAISSTGVNVLKIYSATLVNGEWKNLQELSFNNNEYSCAFPFICDDGMTLLFASDKPGGQGGFDLYISKRMNNGTWSDPVSLGNQVNTMEDEFYPYIQRDVLYFSSRGLNGYGGADIFYGKWNNGQVSDVQNMGKPFNSAHDDFSLVINANGKEGYFSSNREGDSGYDYIYYFNKIVYPDTLRGTVVDRITSKPIEGAKVDLYLVSDEGKETLVNSLITKEDGKWEFLVHPEKRYRIEVSLPGYKTKSVIVPPKSSNETPSRKDVIKSLMEPIELQPEVKKDNIVRIDNIYFDFDKASIMSVSLPILDNLFNFLNENPEARVELSAHTDAVGSDSYNLNLSKKRAQSCFDYLTGKGIDPSRLKPVGYGETKLLNNCKKQADCPDSEHAKNRRVEVKFL